MKITLGLLENIYNDLKNYGEVETCEEMNNVFHVKITNGFKANTLFAVILIIDKAVGKKYYTVKKCIAAKNEFEYKLKQ